ncbi:PREDICTED: aspartic proteinase Asp1 [Nelumbo nucifera]|uniref:Aspartic proteinase Asp1 n=2 Tax=Nelumbo nucifera TaxID=4432 RepID=A0A1U7YZ96_NELNU|nr:PREDICTED: aspartic proteinase Asp1 [Nelumbo nucifera]DAD39738.1 TPA_asm: hypothetical protein HUJ06_014061 [Nelumbo nucifera]
METKGSTMSFLVVSVLVLSAMFQDCSAAFNLLNRKKPSASAAASSSAKRDAKSAPSSVVFPVRGNVYPEGLYYVTLYIGQQPKPYYLDIDTGSDLTWLQCDAPCVSCSQVPHPLYRPKNNLVYCQDPICASVNHPGNHKCERPKDQCDYDIEYADHGSSLGVLVKDEFPLRVTNGSLLKPHLVFGCGYDQEFSTVSSSPTDGVLGLGNSKSSIISQLSDQGLTRNVVGHCFDGQGGGFLFFGDDLVPPSGVVWTPMSRNPLNKYYSPGPAQLIFGGQHTGVKGLMTVFDSGSSYTYFNSKFYQTFISLVRKDLTGKPLKEARDDQTLPICWKGTKPFKSIRDVKEHFKPLTLSFSNGKNARLEILPESYLIISSHGNACLGILNGTEIGLQDINIIGDTLLRDKIVIYDNEKRQIGWIATYCNRLPNEDRGGKASHPYGIDFSILSDQYPAVYSFGDDAV